jgi:hypothetical protein
VVVRTRYTTHTNYMNDAGSNFGARTIGATPPLLRMHHRLSLVMSLGFSMYAHSAVSQLMSVQYVMG